MPSDALLRARERLLDITPLPTDCGKLCQGACCQSPEDEQEQTGMLLFPGEEELYTPEDAAWMRLLPASQHYLGRPIPILVCHAPCPRHKRPLACRFFPLAPRFAKKGLHLRMDARATTLCPLIDSGTQGLSPDFTAAVADAFERLREDPTQWDFLRLIAKQVSDYEKMLRLFAR